MVLKKRLSQENLTAIKNVYRHNPRNMPVLFKALEEVVLDAYDLEKLEILIASDEFIRYLRRSRNFSSIRFAGTVEKIGKKCVKATNVNSVVAILKILLTKEYKDAMRLYFKAPVDYELYDLFESEVFKLAEQNQDMALDYLKLSNEYILKDIKAFYARIAPRTFSYFISRVSALLLNGKLFDDALFISRLLIEKNIRFYVFCFEREKYFNEDGFHVFFPGMFRIIFQNRQEKVLLLMQYLKINRIFLLPYIKNREERLKFIQRSLHIITNLEEKDKEAYLEFIKIYQYNRISRLLWKTLFDAVEPGKLSRYINFFVSKGFVKFYQYYAYNSHILTFLLKHVLICVTGAALEGFPDSLMPVTLKLFIEQKVNMRFLKRRSDFAEWLKEKTSSVRIESLFIRMLFYEYIFLFKKWFKEENGITLTRYMDDIHKTFCITLDEEIKRATQIETRKKLYEQLYILARREIWQPVHKRFPDSTYEITVISGISENLDLDDLFLDEIEKVESEYFRYYYAQIVATVMNHPDDTKLIAESFMHDFWCRVYFDQANIYTTRILLPTIGNYPCYPDYKENLAYTDGKSIYLPSYISLFQDNPENLKNNRNITFYVALTLHETGHIIGGTFKFNITNVIRRLDYPFLYQQIANCFEDYRIEQYLVQIHAHPQAEDIITFMNTKLCLKPFGAVIPDFLCYISLQAAGTFQDVVKLNPEMAKQKDFLYSLKVNTGRFKNMRNLIEYGIERLKHLEIVNPFSIYMLTNEFYEIMKCWPEEYINEIERKTGPKQGWEGKGGGQENQHRVLSRQELEELYRQCNTNPQQFYEEHNIPIFPETFPAGIKSDADKKTDTGPAAGMQSVVQDILEKERGLDYKAVGTFDLARHTKADKEGAVRQKQQNFVDTIREIFTGKKKEKKRKRTVRKKRILSINRDTKTRSIIKECKEYEINKISYNFLNENKKYQHISKSIYKQLAEIIETRAHEIFEYSSIMGDIDMDRLIECLADPYNRLTTDYLEYSRESKKTLRVIIGLDVSGSTGFSITTGDVLNSETILDIEKHFALIFADALKLLTENIDVYGFNSFTATNIYHAVPLEALTGFVSDNGNRDGDFIRYINYLFSENPEDLNYFFLISDGMPNSVNYEGKYALDDTLIAMRESREQNIRLIYFNIDSELREYFGYFKAEALYAEYFSDPHQLLSVIPELVMSIAREVV